MRAYNFKSYPYISFGRHTAARIINDIDGSLGIPVIVLRSRTARSNSVVAYIDGLLSARASMIKYALLIFEPENHVIASVEKLIAICSENKRVDYAGEYGNIYIEQVMETDDDFWDKNVSIPENKTELVAEFDLIDGKMIEYTKAINPQLQVLVQHVAKELEADLIRIDLVSNRVLFMRRIEEIPF